MLRIAFQQPDGSVAVVIAAPKDNLETLIGHPDNIGRRILSDDEYRAHVYARSIPADAKNVHELPDDWVAPDDSRAYRGAWVTDGKVISIDLAGAKEIHKDILRAMRAPLFTKLDVDYQIADEAGDAASKKIIAAKRQALRDVTNDPRINNAGTLAELKLVIPNAVSVAVK